MWQNKNLCYFWEWNVLYYDVEISPLQWRPSGSSVNPDKQEQMKESPMLVQRCSHPAFGVLHMFVSEEWKEQLPDKNLYEIGIISYRYLNNYLGIHFSCVMTFFDQNTKVLLETTL